VNYLIQKSKRSRPMIAHVDKLKPWNTDSPPRSWLTDDHPGGGNEDHGWSADGDMVPGMADTRNAGEQAVDVGVVVLDTGISGHSDGVVKFADPGTVDVGVNREAGGATVIMVPGMVDMGAVNGSGVTDPGLVHTDVDKGSGGSDGVVTLGLDGQDVDATPGDAGLQHYSGQVADNMVDGGHGQHGPGLVDDGAFGGTMVVVPGPGDEYIGETSGQDGVRRGPGGVVDMKGQNASPGQVGGQHGQGGAVDVLGHGTSSGQYDVPGQGMVNVGVNDGADGVVSTGSGNGHRGGTPGRAGEDHGPGIVTEDMGLGTSSRYADGQHGPDKLVDDGHMGDVQGNRDDDRASGDPGDDMQSGQAGGTGVGARSRRYTGDPTGVGAWSRRYTCGPRVEVGTRRPRLGDGSRRQADVQVTDERTSRRQPSSATEATSFIGDSTSDADQSYGGTGGRFDDLAIAGDPQSTHRPLDRPRRAVRLPVRFKDFTL